MNALAKDMSKAYKPSSGQKRDGKYWIEKPVFMLIKETFGPDGLKQFLDARRLAIAREKGKRELGEEETVKQANHTQVEELDVESDMSVETIEDELEMLLEGDQQSFCNHTVVVHVDTRRAALIHQDGFRLIMDSGADTTVIGKGWDIIEYTGSKANLYGFDSKHAKKMNLDIVHAQTVIEQDGNKLVIMVFWAVYNPSSPITLLSMFQLGEGHCRIDPIPKTHKGINGQKGTQGIQFPYSTFHWKFDLDGCMLTLRHRLPTEEEKQSEEYVRNHS